METQTQLLTKTETKPATLPIPAYRPGEIFMSISAFEDAQRMVKPLANSDLVPDTFKGKIGNCLIALEAAQRIGASPLQVMQNLYIVHGKPAWSSQFLVACINASRRFSPLRYKMTGTKGNDDYGCIAWAKDLQDGEILESPEITIGTAKKEGWFSKNGSKWQTMPELMLRYRTATLFARLYAPELTMGIKTEDEAQEIVDVSPVVTEARPSRFEQPPAAIEAKAELEPSDMEKLAALIAEKNIPVTAEQVRDYVESNGEIFSFEMVKPNMNRIAEAILAEVK